MVVDVIQVMEVVYAHLDGQEKIVVKKLDQQVNVLLMPQQMIYVMIM
jgi:hypothetical protein